MVTTVYRQLFYESHDELGYIQVLSRHVIISHAGIWNDIYSVISLILHLYLHAYSNTYTCISLHPCSHSPDISSPTIRDATSSHFSLTTHAQQDFPITPLTFHLNLDHLIGNCVVPQFPQYLHQMPVGGLGPFLFQPC